MSVTAVFASPDFQIPPACPRCRSDLPSEISGRFSCPFCDLVVMLSSKDEEWIVPVAGNVARVAIIRTTAPTANGPKQWSGVFSL